MERLKKRNDVVSSVFFQDEVSSTVLNALKAVDRGSRKTRMERTAAVKACDRMSEVTSFTVASVDTCGQS